MEVRSTGWKIGAGADGDRLLSLGIALAVHAVLLLSIGGITIHTRHPVVFSFLSSDHYDAEVPALIEEAPALIEESPVDLAAEELPTPDVPAIEFAAEGEVSAAPADLASLLGPEAPSLYPGGGSGGMLGKSPAPGWGAITSALQSSDAPKMLAGDLAAGDGDGSGVGEGSGGGVGEGAGEGTGDGSGVGTVSGVKKGPVALPGGLVLPDASQVMVIYPPYLPKRYPQTRPMVKVFTDLGADTFSFENTEARGPRTEHGADNLALVLNKQMRHKDFETLILIDIFDGYRMKWGDGRVAFGDDHWVELYHLFKERNIRMVCITFKAVAPIWVDMCKATGGEFYQLHPLHVPYYLREPGDNRIWTADSVWNEDDGLVLELVRDRRIHVLPGKRDTSLASLLQKYSQID